MITEGIKKIKKMNNKDKLYELIHIIDKKIMNSIDKKKLQEVLKSKLSNKDIDELGERNFKKS